MAVPAPDAALKSLYYVMQSIESKLGGGEGIEGMYGSIKRLGMHKVIQALIEHCNLSSKSHFLDVGAGIGRPLLHALLAPGVASSHGIELDRIKVDKAEAFFKRTALDLQQRNISLDSAPTMCCSPIEEVDTLDPATHAYSFWEGVPPSGKAAFGRLFCESSTLQAVAVVQRAMRADPCAVMGQMGFGPLVLMARFPVSMSGSGRNFTAYTFRRRLVGPSRGLDPLTPAAPKCTSPLADPAQAVNVNNGDKVVTLHLQVDASTAAQPPPSAAAAAPRLAVRQGLVAQSRLLSPARLGLRPRGKPGLAPKTPAQGPEVGATPVSSPHQPSRASRAATPGPSTRLRVGSVSADGRPMQPCSAAVTPGSADEDLQAADRGPAGPPRRSTRQQLLTAQPQRKRP